MEIWVASDEKREEHWSPPGPWSGHRTTVTWTVRLVVDHTAFTLAVSHRDLSQASNRGHDRVHELEYAGDVVRAEDGSLLLEARRRVVAKYEYDEPAEDMWTPAIHDRKELPAGPLSDADRFTLRAVVSERGLSLSVESAGWRAKSFERLDVLELVSEQPLSAQPRT